MTYRRGMKDKILLLHALHMKPGQIASQLNTCTSHVYYTLRAAKKKNEAAKEIAFLHEAIKILEARQ